jgi:hypothetical protein
VCPISGPNDLCENELALHNDDEIDPNAIDDRMTNAQEHQQITKKCLIFLMMVPSMAFANVGETKTSAAKHYGNPVDSAGHWCSYKTNGWVVVQWYNQKGLAEAIVYYKAKGIITENDQLIIGNANLPEYLSVSDWEQIKGRRPGVRAAFITRDNKWAYALGPGIEIVGTTDGVVGLTEEIDIFGNGKMSPAPTSTPAPVQYYYPKESLSDQISDLEDKVDQIQDDIDTLSSKVENN